LKILHLASFSGNIGDRINHFGFYPWISTFFKNNVDWKKLEMRDFYTSKLRFDDSFIELANASDLVIIGGGNYFELWPSHSRTGISIDLLPEDYEKIKTPIFINAIGVDPGQGICVNAHQQLPEIMNFINNSNRILFSVRNDGSKRSISSFISDDTLIDILPDHGFFAHGHEIKSSQIEKGPFNLGINLAMDMNKIRFKGLSEKEFIKIFADKLSELIAKFDIHLTLFSHVYSDLIVLNRVLERIPELFRRHKMTFVEFEDSETNAKRILEKYRTLDLNIGMRFHSNVASIGAGVSTLGLANYPQISNLYEELDQENLCFDVTTEIGIDKLFDEITENIVNKSRYAKINSEMMNKIKTQRNFFSSKLDTWLSNNNLTI
jgi:polysaccharide pyruvyl transferase WcaK-like protein